MNTLLSFNGFVGNTSDEISFDSMSGPLKAKRAGDMITLDFPLNPTEKSVSILLKLEKVLFYYKLSKPYSVSEFYVK